MLGDHLRAAGRWSEQDLEGPPFPQALAYLWGWWQEVGLARAWHDGTASAVGFAEVDAWARLTGTKLRPEEAVALVELDRVWRLPGKLKEEDLGGGSAPDGDEESIWPEGWRDD